MTLFQLILLGVSAFFAYKVYEHVMSLNDETIQKKQEPQSNNDEDVSSNSSQKDGYRALIPTLDSLIEKADEAYMSENLKLAKDYLYEAQRYYDRNQEVLFKLGYICSQQEAYDEAIDFLKSALDIEHDAATHNLLGSIYRAKKEYDSAAESYEAAIRVDELNSVTYFNYANLLLDMKDEQKAALMYQKAIDIDPDFKEAHQELEKLKEEQKDEA